MVALIFELLTCVGAFLSQVLFRLLFTLLTRTLCSDINELGFISELDLGEGKLVSLVPTAYLVPVMASR